MIKKIATANREEWKALRSKYIGGSDAASVVGLNPFSSPYALWAEKTGKTPPFEGNLATDVGTYLEDFIAKMFENASGKKVRRENQSIFNDKYPWAIANIDRSIVGEDSGLECKSTSELNTRRFRGGEYPTNYYCQCVHYLGVSEKKRWFLACLIGNSQFKIFQLTRIEDDVTPEWCDSSAYVSDDEIAALMNAEKEFMENNVKKNIPPLTDGLESTTKAITAIYPQDNGESVSLMAYERDLQQYMNYTESIKHLEKCRDEVANKVKAFLGESARGESNNYKVTWTSASRQNFDAKRFAAEHPEIDLSGYYKTSAYRTFKITENSK